MRRLSIDPNSIPDLSRFQPSRRDVDEKIGTSYSLNLALTVAITIGFLTEGTLYQVTGPVLLDLAHIVGQTAGTVGWILVARALGLGISSFVRGIVIPPEKYRAWVALVFFTLEGVVTAAIPWCSNLVLMIFVFFLQGVLLGYTETDINDRCIQIWGSQHGPYLQMAFAGFSLGGLVAPFIAIPFVKATVEVDQENNWTNQTLGLSAHEIKSDHVISNAKYSSFLGLRFGPIQLLHFIVGLFCLAVGLLLSVLVHMVYKRGPYVPKEEGQVSTEPPKIKKKWVRYLMLFLLGCYVFNVIGVWLTYASFLTAFVVKQLGKTKELGTWVTTAFGSVGVVGNLLAIFLTYKLSPNVVTLINLAVSSIGAISLTIFGSWSIVAVWAGSCALSFGASASYAGTFVWAGKYLPLTIQVSSVLVSASTFGEMGFPMIIGPFFDLHPMSLMYICLTGLILNCIIYVAVETLGKRHCGAHEEASEEDSLKGMLGDHRMYTDDT